MRSPRQLVFVFLILVCALLAPPASATPPTAEVLRPQIVETDAPVQLQSLADTVHQTLLEGVVDFGFRATDGAVQSELPPSPAQLARAEQGWLVGSQIELQGSQVALRLFVVPLGGQMWLGHHAVLDPARVEVTTLRALRTLIRGVRLESTEATEVIRSVPSAAAVESVGTRPSESVVRAHDSSGTAVLALHGAALGGYLGFALQRASGDADARLVYPLSALGAGAGLGAAMVVADEWNISDARAWFLGASAFWPTVATLRILRDDERLTETGDRHAYGLLAAGSGLALATLGLNVGEVDDGGAALTHSAGLFGFLAGGMLELGLEGDMDAPIGVGPGYGALAGTLAAGALAVSFDMPRAEDVLYLDLGAVLGGLGAAALGTPLVVGEERTKAKDRIWLGGVAVGAAAGAAIGWWALREPGSGESPEGPPPARMGFGPMGASGVGLQVQGVW